MDADERRTPGRTPAPRFGVLADEPAVFVDPTGRRARVVRRALAAAALGFTLWLVALVMGATGPAGVPGIRIQPALAVHPHALPARGLVTLTERLPAFGHMTGLAREPVAVHRLAGGEAT